MRNMWGYAMAFIGSFSDAFLTFIFPGIFALKMLN